MVKLSRRAIWGQLRNLTSNGVVNIDLNKVIENVQIVAENVNKSSWDKNTEHFIIIEKKLKRVKTLGEIDKKNNTAYNNMTLLINLTSNKDNNVEVWTASEYEMKLK